jgi:SAM-dependent methyltransferase
MRRAGEPASNAGFSAGSDEGAGMTAAAHPVIDYEEHWSSSVDTYRNHPTSRHRRRFILNRLRRISPAHGQFIFDYGCGAGILLEEIRDEFMLRDRDLGGCDISRAGVAAAQARLPGGLFFAEEFPGLDRQIDIAITSEVIEHTAQYREIIAWLASNLRAGGHLIITTPGGTMDPPDEYYGHIQHFTVPRLTSILEETGCTPVVARNWGFPFFTAQKWVTRRNFESIRDAYMHGELNARKRAIFAAAYAAYHVHDLIPAGPQIFIHARKDRS